MTWAVGDIRVTPIIESRPPPWRATLPRATAQRTSPVGSTIRNSVSYSLAVPRAARICSFTRGWSSG